MINGNTPPPNHLVEVYDAHKHDSASFRTYKVQTEILFESGARHAADSQFLSCFVWVFSNPSILLSCILHNNKHTTKIRWFMLFIYSLLTITNAGVWTTFAPIADQAGTFFNTSENGINMLSMIYMIVYLPGVTILIVCLLGLFFARLFCDVLSPPSQVANCALLSHCSCFPLSSISFHPFFFSSNCCCCYCCRCCSCYCCRCYYYCYCYFFLFFLFLLQTVFGNFLFDDWGIRAGLIVSALLQTVGCWLRYASVYIPAEYTYGSYAVVLIGQGFAGTTNVCTQCKPRILRVKQ